ncbi:MAG: hypothetical protein WCC53_08270 [Thermoanaerobaculia bacterium]
MIDLADLLDVKPAQVVPTVKRLLKDRQRLIKALSDAANRLTLDRTDTRALGFPATPEERAARRLLAEIGVRAEGRR